MKNYLTYIALATCLLAACQQEEIPLPPEDAGESLIRFAAPTISLETGTRSTTIDTLTEGAFGVMGYCVPYYNDGSNTRLNYQSGVSEWSTKHSFCPPNVFYNQKVSIGAEGCTYDNPKFWYREGHDLDGRENTNVTAEAENYHYSFFAYYPYPDDKQSCFSVTAPQNDRTAGAPKFEFIMPQTGDNINTSLDHSLTPDAMFSALRNHERSDGSPNFIFSHLLTALRFEINNYSDQELKVYSVTLSGKFYKKIVLDFTKTGSLNRDPEIMFPEEYYTGSYILYNDLNAPLPLPAEGEAGSSNIYLPQGTNGEPEYILLIAGKEPYFGPVSTEGPELVKVTVEYSLGNETEENSTFATGRPTTFLPQPGTKYTAHLNFVGNAFVLQFTVDNNEEWEDGGSDGDDILFE